MPKIIDTPSFDRVLANDFAAYLGDQMQRLGLQPPIYVLLKDAQGEKLRFEMIKDEVRGGLTVSGATRVTSGGMALPFTIYAFTDRVKADRELLVSEDGVDCREVGRQRHRND